MDENRNSGNKGSRSPTPANYDDWLMLFPTGTKSPSAVSSLRPSSEFFLPLVWLRLVYSPLNRPNLFSLPVSMPDDGDLAEQGVKFVLVCECLRACQASAFFSGGVIAVCIFKPAKEPANASFRPPLLCQIFKQRPGAPGLAF
jgi:hypothetical protein